MSAIIANLQDTAATTHAKATSLLDQRVSPVTRQRYYNSLRQWTESNPRLAAFTAILLTFSLPPTIFFLFSILFVLTATLLTTVSLALLTTFAFTATAVSFGLLILLPTLFIAFITTNFLFISGLAGYAIYNILSAHPRTAPYVDAAKRKTLETSSRASSVIQDITQSATSQHNTAFNNQSSKSTTSLSSDDATGTLTDSATAVRDYFGAIDGSKQVYGNHKIVADTSKSSGIVTPGGTLPRNRSYSKPSTAKKPADIDLGDPAVDVRKKRTQDGDVTPLVLEDPSRDEFLPVNGAKPAEMGKLGRTVAPV